MKKRVVTKISFDNFSDARRCLRVSYRRRLTELRSNDALSTEDKHRRLKELRHGYHSEFTKLQKQYMP